jgi:hypothetical protein
MNLILCAIEWPLLYDIDKFLCGFYQHQGIDHVLTGNIGEKKDLNLLLDLCLSWLLDLCLSCKEN